LIDHIVLFKLKPGADTTAIENMCTALEDLKHRIPQVIEIHARPNFSERRQGYDIMLTSRFKNKEDLRIYADHPEHLRVVKELVAPIRESVIVGDIEF